MKKTRCNLWWCWREAAGSVRILIETTSDGQGKIFYNIPYCKKHGEIAKEVIAENDFNFNK